MSVTIRILLSAVIGAAVMWDFDHMLIPSAKWLLSYRKEKKNEKNAEECY